MHRTVVSVSFLLLLGAFAGVSYAQISLPPLPATDIARLKARTMCSCLFVQHMSFSQCSDGTSALWRFPSQEESPPLLISASQTLDVRMRTDGAVVRMAGSGKTLAQSRYIADGGGCVTLPTEVPAESIDVAHGPIVGRQASAPLPRGAIPANADARAIEATLDAGFSQTGPMQGVSRAAIVLHGGRIVAERYAPGYGPQHSYYIASISKVFNNLFAALLTADGKLDVTSRVDLPDWRQDDRRSITYDHLLRMTSGLDWDEQFVVPGAPAYEISFTGNASLDVARAVARRPLEAQPGTHFEYSTGGSILLASLLQARLDRKDRATTLKYLQERLFAPIGANTITPEFDLSGTLLFGLAAYAGAEDLARIGLLLQNGGRWGREQLLPQDWLAYSTEQRRAGDVVPQYGAQLRTGIPQLPGCFGHSGFGQQKLLVCPRRDLVIVWLSSAFNLTPGKLEVGNDELIGRLIAAFPQAHRSAR